MIFAPPGNHDIGLRPKPALPRLAKVFMLPSIMKQTTSLFLICSIYVFLVGCASSLQSVEQNTGWETSENVVRLSSQVVPKSYELDLFVDPNLENFRGRAQISFDLNVQARRIVLHGQDLMVESATLELSGSDAGPLTVSWKETHDDGTAVLQVCSPALSWYRL